MKPRMVLSLIPYKHCADRFPALIANLAISACCLSSYFLYAIFLFEAFPVPIFVRASITPRVSFDDSSAIIAVTGITLLPTSLPVRLKYFSNDIVYVIIILTVASRLDNYTVRIFFVQWSGFTNKNIRIFTDKNGMEWCLMQTKSPHSFMKLMLIIQIDVLMCW